MAVEIILEGGTRLWEDRGRGKLLNEMYTHMQLCVPVCNIMCYRMGNISRSKGRVSLLMETQAGQFIC